MSSWSISSILGAVVFEHLAERVLRSRTLGRGGVCGGGCRLLLRHLRPRPPIFSGGSRTRPNTRRLVLRRSACHLGVERARFRPGRSHRPRGLLRPRAAAKMPPELCAQLVRGLPARTLCLRSALGSGRARLSTAVAGPWAGSRQISNTLGTMYGAMTCPGTPSAPAYPRAAPPRSSRRDTARSLALHEDHAALYALEAVHDCPISSALCAGRGALSSCRSCRSGLSCPRNSSKAISPLR